jgi:hypothetical protein
MTHLTAWERATIWEGAWWGNCHNTFGEELKQFVYAPLMGLEPKHNGQQFYIDLHGQSVLDVGAGPVSLLLKAHNGSRAVVDPCDYPSWTVDRYLSAGISVYKMKAEDMTLTGFDEVWLYNVLQHVEDPEKIVKNCLAAGKIVRVFEWIECGVSDGHIHNLTEPRLNLWFGGKGTTQYIDKDGAVGWCYYGVFQGSNQ